MAVKKQRLDQLLFARNLAGSREKAQGLIRAGKVMVNGQSVSKPGHGFQSDVEITVEAGTRYVSRGGEKLDAALQTFQPLVEGQVCLDIGASTGGFTDCLLQHGAQRVYAVDVGRGQLDWTLRQDPRVVVMERVNARYLTTDAIPDVPALAVIDVSFISLTRILPVVTEMIESGGHLLPLIKPQFEAGRQQVEKGGVVRSTRVREEVIEMIRRFSVNTLGLKWIGTCESVLRGPAGNVEYFAYLEKPTVEAM